MKLILLLSHTSCVLPFISFSVEYVVGEGNGFSLGTCTDLTIMHNYSINGLTLRAGIGGGISLVCIVEYITLSSSN